MALMAPVEGVTVAVASAGTPPTPGSVSVTTAFASTWGLLAQFEYGPK